ncbi:MAG: DUF1566 domain-containing protein [Desulforegulaceae bacterium]|nr:DUF1566 domain-containing protein [Desulforegulaceae bacterium]
MKKKLVQVKGCLRKNLVVFLGMMMVFCVAGAVQAAQQLPDFSRFQELEGSNGSILRDTHSGLEWQRCPYGQSWTGSGCSGTAWRGKWDDAVRITAPGGFRLPTVDELRTLHPYDIFSGGDFEWSSSSYPYLSGAAWGLESGVTAYGKSNNGRARLVRGGQ